MNRQTQLKTAPMTLNVANRRRFLYRLKIRNVAFATIILFALGCIALCPRAQAVNPPPDGGYPGGNTAEGQNALFSLTTGTFNTAVGFFSLRSNTTGNFNTAIGAGALLLTTADENTATGAGALLSSSGGFGNTANGAFALFSDTDGDFNTATGDGALFHNTTGGNNTATGFNSLAGNSTGDNNTAVGVEALLNNSTGFQNTANGGNALQTNTTGFNNTAIGFNALLNCTGVANTALGYLAGSNLTFGNDNIYISNAGVASDSAVIRIGESFIGATYIAGIFNGTLNENSFFVGVDDTGKLGDHVGSAPGLRFRDVIEDHKKIAELKAAMAALTAQLKDQATQIQKVSAQVEMYKPATRVVIDNP